MFGVPAEHFRGQPPSTDPPGRGRDLVDDKTVYVLVGPKGAGKSHLGRLAERCLGVSFVDVESIALNLPEGSSPNRLYAMVEDEVARRLAETDEAILEVTGASPGTAMLFDHLRQGYALRLIQVSAPLATCLARVETRDASTHLPSTPELVRTVWERSMAADFPYDLRLETLSSSDADLLAGIQSLRA